MTKDREFRVYYTQTEDGSWLAASVATPWFCVSAPTKEDVQAKAQRAVNFWCENRSQPLKKKPARTVTPFAPQSVETLRPVALCG